MYTTTSPSRAFMDKHNDPIHVAGCGCVNCTGGRTDEAPEYLDAESPANIPLMHYTDAMALAADWILLRKEMNYLTEMGNPTKDCDQALREAYDKLVDHLSMALATTNSTTSQDREQAENAARMVADRMDQEV